MTEMNLAYEGVEACAKESVDVENAWKLFSASKKRNFVAVQISPAVRVAIGEKFGLRRGEDGVGKVAAALTALGADAVVDTAIASDAITLMKAKELRVRKDSGKGLPLYSSECTVWVEFAKANYPEIAENLLPTATTVCAKLLKKYYAAKNPDKKIRVIALEIGAAKKADAGVDVVLTLEELAQILDASQLNVRLMKKAALETPFGVSSGAGYIAAASGGDAEAIARVLGEDKTQNALRKLEYCGIYDKKDRREATLELGGESWKLAVADTLAAAETLIADINAGATYDYVEVTACAGGQVGLGCDLSDAEGEMTRRLRKLGLKYLDFSRAARSADMSSAAEMVVKSWNALVRSGEAEALDVIDEIVDDPEEVEEVMEEIAGELVEETVENAVEEAVEEVVEEIVEQITEAIGEAVDKETLEEIVEDTVEDVIGDAAEESIDEIVETVAEAIEEDLADGVADFTVEELVDEAVSDAVGEIVEETADEVIEEVVEEIVEAVVEEAVEQIVEETAEETPVEEASEEQPIEEVIEEVAEVSLEAIEEVAATEAVEEVVEEIAEELPIEEIPVEDTVEETVEEVVEEPVEETADEIVEETAEEVEEEPVEEVPEVSAEEVQAEIAHVVELLNVAEEDLTPAQKAARAAYYRRLSTKERRKLKRLKRNSKK